MIGQFVISKAGHDKGNLYVVVAEEGNFVYLSDGRLKEPEHPKKKCRKHIQLINAWVDSGLRNKLESKEMVRMEEVKFAVRQFKQFSKM